MKIETDREKDALVAVLPGPDLDAANAREVRESLWAAIKGEPRVLLDMSGLQFIDSSGCGVLLSILRDVRAAGGDARMFGVTPTVDELFTLIHMYRMYEAHPTRDAAAASFSDADGDG